MKLRLLAISAVTVALSAGLAGPAFAGDFDESPTEDAALETETQSSGVQAYCGAGSGGGDPALASATVRLASSEDCSNVYYCRRVDVARVHRSLLGFVVFKFWHWKRWCYRHPRILSVGTGTYVTNVDPNYRYGGVVSASQHYYVWCCYRGDSGHVSFRQARFDNCVPWVGCLSTVYPWVRIRAHSDGSYTWQTGT
jgi:hypothetical protein